MTLQLTGRIVEIYPAQQITERFKKQEFILDISETKDGVKYDNYAKLQTAQNKCELLTTLRIGDEVTVSFNVRGNRWEKDGKVNYINSLDVWKIDSVSKASEQKSTPTKPGYSQGGDDLPF